MRSANGCHDVTAKVRRLRIAVLVLRDEEKKKESTAGLASGEQESRGRGERPPDFGHRITLVRGWVSVS